jgi:class 3 adenylate cyclase
MDFGTRVIQRAFEFELDGTAELTFEAKDYASRRALRPPPRSVLINVAGVNALTGNTRNRLIRMEAPTLDRRLVAILAADLESYSRLMALDEEAALATLSAHRAIADELIVAFRGRIANTAGDSVLAGFASVVDAVRCAIEVCSAYSSGPAARRTSRALRAPIMWPPPSGERRGTPRTRARR